MLKPLDYKSLAPTRDYLRDVALAMGSLQRGFLEPNPHDWQHGVEVTMRGLATQPFIVNGNEERVILDLVKSRVRLGEINWLLEEYSGAEIFKNFKVWLQSKGISVELDEPEFIGKSFDAKQAKYYAEALWWMHKEFQIMKAEMAMGLTAPILLYPHHFDLSLVWFPHHDEKQMSIGFSTGDETIPEPYLYVTLYPESSGLVTLLGERLPSEAYWQKDGFSGAILPYAALAASDDPDELLRSLVGQLSSYAVANGF